jgi:hypothetical protein
VRACGRAGVRLDDPALPCVMRRGLLKDLANTPTQMACGWRLYGDLKRLAELSAQPVTIDLLSGSCSVNGASCEPPLIIAVAISQWLRERIAQDGVPPGSITTATLTLTPQTEAVPNLSLKCSTVIETESGRFSSDDLAFWDASDVAR